MITNKVTLHEVHEAISDAMTLFEVKEGEHQGEIADETVITDLIELGAEAKLIAECDRKFKAYLVALIELDMAFHEAFDCQ